VSEMKNQEMMRDPDRNVMRTVEILKQPVELFKILKFEGMVSSGGEAKMVIADGQVVVNGDVETRKRKKIINGDVIEFGEDIIRIEFNGQINE
jgi:ribosome-associated protein